MVGDRVRITRGHLEGFHATVVPNVESNEPGWQRVELVTTFFANRTRPLPTSWLEQELP